MKIINGNEEYDYTTKGIYVADINYTKKGYEVYHNLIAQKLMEAGFDGTVYIDGEKLTNGIVKNESDYSNQDFIKAQSDVILYFIGGNVSADDAKLLFEDIMNHYDKAVIGCWPFSNLYGALKEYLVSEPYKTMDETTNAAINKINLVREKQPFYDPFVNVK